MGERAEARCGGQEEGNTKGACGRAASSALACERGRVLRRPTARYTGFAGRCIADQYWPIRGFQNPVTASLMDKFPRPWRSFCNGTAVGGQKPGFETFRNFLISEMPGLFVKGSKQPRLEKKSSQVRSYFPVYMKKIWNPPQGEAKRDNNLRERSCT